MTLDACQTCGEAEGPATLSECRVNSPLLDGTPQWERLTLCPSCQAELEGAGRVGSMFDQGRADRLAGKGALSAHGRYLDGWYSVPGPTMRRTRTTRSAVATGALPRRTNRSRRLEASDA